MSRMIKMMEGFSQRLSILAAMVESNQEATGSGGSSNEVPPIPIPHEIHCSERYWRTHTR